MLSRRKLTIKVISSRCNLKDHLGYKFSKRYISAKLRSMY